MAKKLYLFIFLLIAGCAYYNTMFNAENLYDEGIKKIANNTKSEITPDIRKDFYSAIDKCWKLINIYGDSSEYADDALLLIGKSYYNVEEYPKSERYLSQFLKKYKQSELFPDATLWYAKSLIQLDRESEALTYLNELLSSDLDEDFKSEVYYSMGLFYRKNEELTKSVTNLQKCVDLSEDDLRSATAQFEIGEIYFEQKDFIKAIDNYNKVREFDSPLEIEYRSLMQKVEAQLRLEEYDLALKSLQLILRDVRFQEKYAMVEAKIGETYVLNDKMELAVDHYFYVLDKYPRTEGSAEASFGLAQIMEFQYMLPDSARKLYLRVPKEYSRSEKSDESRNRAKILQDYIKLSTALKESWNKLSMALHADTATVDTVASELPADSVSLETDSLEVLNEEEKNIELSPQKLSLIRKDIAEKQYKMAEFYLLTLDNPDSAIATYNKFINTGFDSTLIPKAYFALYYIYDFVSRDSLNADSIAGHIQQFYPESPFAGYFKNRGKKIKKTEVEIDTLKNRYLSAENQMHSGNYLNAISELRNIAQVDSGGDWGGKSRYAIAWIYEKNLKDMEQALAAYKTLLTEYPNSPYAGIAKNKIKEPEPEVVLPDSSAIGDSLNVSVPPDSLQPELEP